MAAVTLKVKVKPRARTSELAQAADGTWVAKLKAPPVDGKANEELVALVAEHFPVVLILANFFALPFFWAWYVRPYILGSPGHGQAV